MKMRASLHSTRPHGAARLYLRRFGAALRLLGVRDGDRGAGLYMCEPFDPDRRTVVMIHGLGGDAVAWAHLTQAIERSAELHACFQVWHLVYNSNAPFLVVRRRAEGYLDEAWERLDPGGHAQARTGIVLVGHSLGGVVARMLCVDSGNALWSAAFSVHHHAVQDDEVAAKVAAVFRFQPYPGVGRAIFLAAPHKGSPNADRWLGRLVGTLLGGRTAEIQELRTLVQDRPDIVHDELRETYQRARVNSVFTLRASQPVRRASEALLPHAGIPYHTIAGTVPGTVPPGDGVVPLSSALLAGAASTLVVRAGHNLYDKPEVVAEVLRILREDMASRG
ncbi:alpha/beta hydrolase [Lysobacter sp. S4-A87]|uniref:esterase/lipase family protein n=1 Tax=Lysobacter sp. S4-A87 TaxID=2925843 RepID=UPI001F532553|nr:alpha/beta hydrolase [Lysobacter sp. S4-A87]UNK49917.1 alpha/beta hydrolase [Lysobacter sp. S4-A87]